MVIDVRPTEAAVGARLCELFANAARDAIAEKGSFVVAVPGGSVLKMLGGLKEQKGAVDWSKGRPRCIARAAELALPRLVPPAGPLRPASTSLRSQRGASHTRRVPFPCPNSAPKHAPAVHLFYVNHKVLPHSDQASTHKKALEGFARSVGLPEANVAAPLEPAPGQVRGGRGRAGRLAVVVGWRRPPFAPARSQARLRPKPFHNHHNRFPPGQDLSAAASAAASDYESRLRAAAGSLGLPLTPFPRFDWMLLGTGADGHVGSLYPNKPTLDEKEAWVIPFQKSAEAASITLSLPVMAAGREVVVCLTGAKKARGRGGRFAGGVQLARGFAGVCALPFRARRPAGRIACVNPKPHRRCTAKLPALPRTALSPAQHPRKHTPHPPPVPTGARGAAGCGGRRRARRAAGGDGRARG